MCKRFNIDNYKREKHTALIDCGLLKEVYINLLDQKEPRLNLETRIFVDTGPNENKNSSRKIIKLSTKELELHKNYLKTNLKSNFYD